MKIVNLNDKIRKYLSRLIKDMSIKEEDNKCYDLFYDLYDNVKNNSGAYDYLLGLVFESSYVITKFTLKMYPDDKELMENFSNLKKVSNIEDLKIMLTMDLFLELLYDTDCFYDSDSYFKRNVVEYSLEDKDFLMKIFPSFLIDVLSYLNMYDTTSILNNYNDRKKQNDKDAFNNTIKMSVEDLINLEQKDFEAYKYIILEMIEVFYAYKKYMIYNNYIYDDIDIIILSMIEENLISIIYYSINNISMLEKIITGYLEYSLLSIEDKKDINEYNSNENNKNYSKVLNTCKKLKCEKK